MPPQPEDLTDFLEGAAERSEAISRAVHHLLDAVGPSLEDVINEPALLENPDVRQRFIDLRRSLTSLASLAYKGATGITEAFGIPITPGEPTAAATVDTARLPAAGSGATTPPSKPNLLPPTPVPNQPTAPTITASRSIPSGQASTPKVAQAGADTKPDFPPSGEEAETADNYGIINLPDNPNPKHPPTDPSKIIPLRVLTNDIIVIGKKTLVLNKDQAYILSQMLRHRDSSFRAGDIISGFRTSAADLHSAFSTVLRSLVQGINGAVDNVQIIKRQGKARGTSYSINPNLFVTDERLDDPEQAALLASRLKKQALPPRIRPQQTKLHNVPTEKPEKTIHHPRDRAILSTVRAFNNDAAAQNYIAAKIDTYRSAEGTARGKATQDEIRWYFTEIRKYRLLDKADEEELFTAIDRGIEVFETHGLQNLTPDQRAALIDMVAAYQIVICTNLPLVVSLAKSYMHNTFLAADLIQEGNEGLAIAVRHFEVSKGNKFSTYATWWIRQSISRGLINLGRTIRMPVHAHGQWARLHKASKQLAQELGHEPTPEQVAAHTGHSIDDANFLLLMGSKQLTSLDARLEDGESAFGDFVSKDDLEWDIDRISDSEELANLAPKAGLTAREAVVLSLRFDYIFPHMLGALVKTVAGQKPYEEVLAAFSSPDDDNTLDAISKLYGVSRETIRQNEINALEKLRIAAGQLATTNASDIL